MITGSAYKLKFLTFIGSAFGGQAFLSNPQIAVADRGGNVVTSYNGDLLYSNISLSPFANQSLQPLSNTVSEFIDGIATFSGLFINKSGYPYQLTFHTYSVLNH